MPNIQENNPKLGVMVDCSRNSVMNVEALRSLIPVLSKIGYTTLMLYTEDTYEVNGEPYFGYLRGRYSKAELKEIDRIAAASGVELVPCIQTLAHLRGIFRWKEYAEIRDTADILLADDERTYELIEHIFETLAECFTSRHVNIGMDEAHALGSGKYREFHGEVPRAEIMLKHLKRVNEIANKHGFNCSMWSDMFFYAAFGGTNFSDKEEEIPKEIADNIPDNVTLIYWDYYSLDEENYAANIRSHLKLTDRLTFAGGVWSWVGAYSAQLLRYTRGESGDGGLSEKRRERDFYYRVGRRRRFVFAVLGSARAGAYRRVRERQFRRKIDKTQVLRSGRGALRRFHRAGSAELFVGRSG